MRCPSCNKFPSLETQDPEVDLDINGTCVTATVRLVRASECCGEECKTADFDPTDEIDFAEFAGHIDPTTGKPLEVGEDETEHELEVEEVDVEATERVEGKGRGARTFYGFKVRFSVSCACGKGKDGKDAGDDKVLYEGELEDEIQASHMEEMS